MRIRTIFPATLAVVLAGSVSAWAGDLPAVKIAANNPVPECATPGRMMAYLKNRNPALDQRFDQIAVDYMRHGEVLGLRWDYAFFQMVVETGGLTFQNGSRQGSVRPAQNNFAGLGATGKGERGESFPDVSTGVLAHLQHVLLYAGDEVKDAVAERTRKVHEWGVLTAWQKGFKRPITFADLGAKWAPGSRSYADSIESVGDKFYGEFCKGADPRPELLAMARGGSAPAQTAEAKTERVGAEVARKAIAEQRAEENASRSGLGAGSIAKALPGPGVKILNAPPEPVGNPDAQAAPTEALKQDAVRADPPKSEPRKSSARTTPATPPAPPAQADKPMVQPAAAAAAGALAKPLSITAPLVPAKGQKCRVWTASYGGQKALIVQALVDSVINFTVLDVNEGQEYREADAFITTYAKGGSVAGEFTTQGAALEKAFELCPEG